MSISIVIPSLNQGQYLEETLQSVLSSNANEEFLVIDGGSTDNSVEIINKYRDKIYWYVSEKDSGQSNAINKGFLKARANIVSWLCSDDLYTPGALELVEKEFSVLSSDYILIYGDTEVFNKYQTIRINKGHSESSIERHLSGMAFSQPSSFFKKSALDKVGLLDERLHYGMDYDLFVRLALVGKFKKVNHCFSRYRLHEESKSVALHSQFLKDWAFVFFRVLTSLKHEQKIIELTDLGIEISLPMEEVKPYPVVEIDTSVINVDLTVYYFLRLIISQDYMSGNFVRASVLINYTKNKYAHFFADDHMLRPIVSRMSFPGPFGIKILRKFRSLIK